MRAREHDIYMWICDAGHYMGMSTLGDGNPNYVDGSKKGKQLPTCPHCRGNRKRKLYKVMKVEPVE